MSEHHHTPGPWFHDLNDGHYPIVRAPSAWIVAKTDCSLNGVYIEDREERIANARLIAAAPELLDELESLSITIRNLISDADNRRPWSPHAADNLRAVRDRIRDVTLKATGKEPA